MLNLKTKMMNLQKEMMNLKKKILNPKEDSEPKTEDAEPKKEQDPKKKLTFQEKMALLIKQSWNKISNILLYLHNLFKKELQSRVIIFSAGKLTEYLCSDESLFSKNFIN